MSFLFNGGPGSASMWLHMGSVGPKRVVTTNGVYTPPAPYPIVDNQETLLHRTDLVFIDAMGTGFSRIAGRGTERDFYGVDEDAAAFAQFITTWLSRNGRWNSPKFVIGESYGTYRAAVVSPTCCSSGESTSTASTCCRWSSTSRPSPLRPVMTGPTSTTCPVMPPWRGITRR